MSFKNLFKIFSFFSVFIILVPYLFIPIIISNASDISFKNDLNFSKNISNSEFIWPIPGYTRISSYFGKRYSPTDGASTYHLGIDIPAPHGTNLIAPCNSIVSSIGFNGSGGFSILLRSENFEFIYYHVSPNYIVSKNDIVRKRSNYRSSRSKKCIWG